MCKRKHKLTDLFCLFLGPTISDSGGDQSMVSFEEEKFSSSGANYYQSYCPECGFTDSDLAVFKDHMITFHGYISFCKVCGEGFKNKFVYSQHMDIHKASLKCHVCGKSYVTLGNLQSHMVCHSNYKEFKCHLCSKSYKRKNKLVKHWRNCHPREMNFHGYNILNE